MICHKPTSPSHDHTGTHKQIHILYGSSSLTPTNSASVDIVLFSFFLLDFQCTIPYPNYMQPPMWLFRSGCTPYAASTHVHNCLRLSAPMILLSQIFCFGYCNTHLNLAFSSLVILVTLVNSNDIAVSMSGLPPFATHSSFQP